MNKYLVHSQIEKSSSTFKDNIDEKSNYGPKRINLYES